MVSTSILAHPSGPSTKLLAATSLTQLMTFDKLYSDKSDNFSKNYFFML